jgi:hypothetical protein
MVIEDCLFDDLGDAICVILGRFVMEMARETCVDYALFEALILSGDQSSNFSDGTSSKLIGAEFKVDNFASNRAEVQG